MTTTPELLEREHTLATAAGRFDQLRTWEALGEPTLGREEALELLSLGEVIARKVGYGRQLTIRTARQAGASWTQIGNALGTTKQSAWESHARWIDEQTAAGWDGEDAEAARRLVGDPDDPGSRRERRS
ncbi:MAG TPA: hypothetical protein VI011_00655 [Asanoa sp.]